MCDRQGNYREAGYVNVTEAAAKLLPMSVNQATYGDVAATDRAVEHVRHGRQNADGTFTSSVTEAMNRMLGRDGVQWSLDLDQDYMDAVNIGDMETARRMVDEAAKAAGFTIKGYHGTSSDFNVFDPSRSGEDWQGDSRLGPGLYFAHSRREAQQWTEGTRVSSA